MQDMTKKPTCKNLLTAKVYGKVAWAEGGTEALLKAYNGEKRNM